MDAVKRKGNVYGMVCGFRFVGGGACGAKVDHAVHHDAWSGREENHRFQPLERRGGIERRGFA